VLDQWGSPNAGVEVEAFAPSGASIWTGTTDAQGVSVIPIEFTDADYSQFRRIELVTTGDSVQVEFLSDTPIQLAENP